MPGYEQVNKQAAELPAPTSDLREHRRPALELASSRESHERWVIDLSEVAAEPPAESIAREREILERM